MNRELGILRRILNVALREGWITKSPFNAGESLISPASERRRERILTLDEERRLLSACASSSLKELRSLVICLLDTGARLSEILKHLRSDSVSFESRTITLEAMTTKTTSGATGCNDRATLSGTTNDVECVRKDQRGTHFSGVHARGAIRFNCRLPSCERRIWKSVRHYVSLVTSYRSDETCERANALANGRTHSRAFTAADNLSLSFRRYGNSSASGSDLRCPSTFT
jgi:hypothetical protein